MEKVGRYHLKKVLGLSFGLAVMVGGIIGVGILRNPGLVAAILPYKWLIISAWIFGGIYVLMALGSLAELAAMLPKAGGTFNYVKRAYGYYPGFVIGWFDYINNAIAPGYFSIVIAEYIILLFPAIQGYDTVIALCALITFTLLNLTGVKSGSLTQQITSFVKVLTFLAFVIFCFVLGGNDKPSARLPPNLGSTVINGGLILAFIKALQLCVGTYDGWNAPTFMAEEDTNPGKNIPRSLFGGAIIVMIVYVSINIALLYVLPISAIAGSQLAVANAAEVIFGKAGYTILIVIALFSLLSILNAQMMISSRILYGLSHEGLFIKKGTLVNKGGTPYVVMIITALIGIITISIGSFERLFSLSAFMTVVGSIMMFASLFKLRKSEPALPRPYRAWGYPWIPMIMLLVSISLFISYSFADTKNFLVILTITTLTWPAFWLIKRNNQ